MDRADTRDAIGNCARCWGVMERTWLGASCRMEQTEGFLGLVGFLFPPLRALAGREHGRAFERRLSGVAS